MKGLKVFLGIIFIAYVMCGWLRLAESDEVKKNNHWMGAYGTAQTTYTLDYGNSSGSVTIQAAGTGDDVCVRGNPNDAEPKVCVEGGGKVEVAGTLEATGDLQGATGTFSGNLTSKNATVSQSLRAGLDIDIDRNLNVDGDAQVDGTLNSDYEITAGDGYLSGGVTITAVGEVEAGSHVYAVGNIESTTGDVEAGDDVIANDDVRISSGNNLVLDNSTDTATISFNGTLIALSLGATAAGDIISSSGDVQSFDDILVGDDVRLTTGGKVIFDSSTDSVYLSSSGATVAASVGITANGSIQALAGDVTTTSEFRMPTGGKLIMDSATDAAYITYLGATTTLSTPLTVIGGIETNGGDIFSDGDIISGGFIGASSSYEVGGVPFIDNARVLSVSSGTVTNNWDVSGDVFANAYHGDGSALTGITATLDSVLTAGASSTLSLTTGDHEIVGGDLGFNTATGTITINKQWTANSAYITATRLEDYGGSGTYHNMVTVPKMYIPATTGDNYEALFEIGTMAGKATGLRIRQGAGSTTLWPIMTYIGAAQSFVLGGYGQLTLGDGVAITGSINGLTVKNDTDGYGISVVNSTAAPAYGGTMTLIDSGAGTAGEIMGTMAFANGTTLSDIYGWIQGKYESATDGTILFIPKRDNAFTQPLMELDGPNDRVEIGTAANPGAMTVSSTFTVNGIGRTLDDTVLDITSDAPTNDIHALYYADGRIEFATDVSGVGSGELISDKTVMKIYAGANSTYGATDTPVIAIDAGNAPAASYGASTIQIGRWQAPLGDPYAGITAGFGAGTIGDKNRIMFSATDKSTDHWDTTTSMLVYSDGVEGQGMAIEGDSKTVTIGTGSMAFDLSVTSDLSVTDDIFASDDIYMDTNDYIEWTGGFTLKHDGGGAGYGFVVNDGFRATNLSAQGVFTGRSTDGTCDASNRGYMYNYQETGAATDALKICQRKADGSYAFATVTVTF